MQRINNLLQKLTDLSNKNSEPEIIDIDLMLDYTKVIYADLLEMRGRIAFNSSLISEPASPVAKTETNNIPEAISQPEPEEKVEVSEPLVLPTVEETEKIAEPIVTTATVNHDVDIRKVIGINDKYLFISELFNNSSEAYEDVVNKLNNFRSYPEAISWLDEVHSENNWDDDNETVVSFYDLINHYFASK
jgi:hypothetical protein